MAISEAYANSASIGTTEYSITANSTSLATQTTDGIYQVFLDLNAVTVADVFVLHGYEKVQSSGTKRKFYSVVFRGPSSSPNFVSPAFTLLHGWDFTLTKVSGTDRTIEWSVRSIA